MLRMICGLILLLPFVAQAAPDKIKFSFKNTELVKVIEEYSKLSGQKFIFDETVKGKATILNAEPVTLDEAFNQLSSALALNSFAISKQDDVFVVMPARAVQRNKIDVMTELPSLKPEKMVTMIFHLKHARADDLNKQLRILASRDGELVPYSQTNQLIVTDWVSNLHRIAAIIKNIDQPAKKAR